jgi:hypothetical protein
MTAVATGSFIRDGAPAQKALDADNQEVDFHKDYLGWLSV